MDIDPTLITTAYGKVQGQLLFGAKGTIFNGFQGIPYAKPPVGNLRFRVRKNYLNKPMVLSYVSIHNYQPNPWANNADPTLNTRLATALGWNGVGGSAGIYNTLMSADPFDIVNAQNQMTVVELLYPKS